MTDEAQAALRNAFSREMDAADDLAQRLFNERNAELRAKRERQEHHERVFLWTVGGFMACVLLAVASVLWR